VEVRRLGPGDEEALRAVRLTALATDPDVFGSTLAGEEPLGPAAWTRRLSPPSITVVVGDPPVAMAWGVPDVEDLAVAHLYGMWVAPAHRGSGAAAALLDAVVAWATEVGRRRLVLTVVEGNDRAERLYRRRGFVRDGQVETRPRDGRVEAQMVLALPAPAG